MTTQQQQELDIETVVRWLLAQDYMTPEEICETIDGTELIEDCVVFETTPWTASDGTADLDFDRESCEKFEVADRYVDGGDWGDDPSGSVEISVWRWGIDANGNDCAVDCDTYDVHLINVIDHAKAIRRATHGDGCGNDPDDHYWTSEGEGGLKENPGVWSTGGTSMTVMSHCRRCGLHRTVFFSGVQRNPGQGDSVEYRMLSDDEIAEHRARGTMDADDDEMPQPDEPQIRFSVDGTVSIVWCDDEPLRAPTQQDIDTLPVGPDLTDEEIETLPE